MPGRDYYGSFTSPLKRFRYLVESRRKRVIRQRDETPEDQYRRAAQDLQRMCADACRDSDRKSKRQSDPYGGSGV
jgi:hypothetical protein